MWIISILNNNYQVLHQYYTSQYMLDVIIYTSYVGWAFQVIAIIRRHSCQGNTSSIESQLCRLTVTSKTHHVLGHPRHYRLVKNLVIIKFIYPVFPLNPYPKHNYPSYIETSPMFVLVISTQESVKFSENPGQNCWDTFFIDAYNVSVLKLLYCWNICG